MTVPELRFALLDRPRVGAVVRLESLRRERRAGLDSTGDDETGDVWERLDSDRLIEVLRDLFVLILQKRRVS